MAKKRNKEAREERSIERSKIDRDQALRSLDKAKIVAYLRKYGETVEENEIIFWANVHRARLAIKSFSHIEKAISERWVKDNRRFVVGAYSEKVLQEFKELKERRAS